MRTAPTLFSLVFSIAFMVFASAGHACVGAYAEVQTYLEQLPEDAEEKPVIAKVKLVGYPILDERLINRTQVKVIEAISGVETAQEFKVLSKTHSCSLDEGMSKGDTFYIAGYFNAYGEFFGEWKENGPKPPY